MRIGLIFDLRNPVQWQRDASWVFARALEVAEEADHLGADSVWASEHHFFADGYLPQPMLFCAAVAARTRRVRLGTAIMIAPLRPAVQIAEEVAVLDLLSGGRVDIGLGAGYRVPEFDAFGADVRRRFSNTLERARAVRRMLTDGTVTPAPLQRDVPMWLGYRQPRGAYETGRLGEGLQRLDRELLGPYRQGLLDGGHDVGSARMAGSLGIFVADDPEAAWVRIRPHLSYMWDSYHAASVEGTGVPPPAPIDPERWRISVKGRPPRFQVLTPDDAVSFIEQSVRGLPVVDLAVWSTLPGLPPELADRHVELMLTQVRPRVAGLGVTAA